MKFSGNEQETMNTSKTVQSPPGIALHGQKKKQIEDLVGALAKSAVRSIGSRPGRQIARGLLDSLLGGKRR